MRGISLRARDRELKIMLLREEMNLSFRQIGAVLGISHVAAYKRYWYAMLHCKRDHSIVRNI